MGDALASSSLGTGLTTLVTNPYVDAAGMSWGLSDAANKTRNGQYGNSLTEDAMTALELTPLGYGAGKGLDTAYNIGKQALQTAYDNGTFYDKYTTLGGRFGNWGDTWLDKVWGTTARRFNLPDKAKIPGDAIRKISHDITVKDGLVNFTGTKGFNGLPHTNFTLDRPVVSHPWGSWNGADTYIMPA